MNTKETILDILKTQQDTPISGESLAQTLGISRAAVHKAINALRDEGYRITAATNSGYRLSDSGSLITMTELRRYLPDTIPVHLFQSVDSTNTTAKKMALEGAPHGTCVMALHQNHGKGRLGRTFLAPVSNGIYLSMILKPTFDVSKSVLITTAASVAVCRAIKKVCGVDPQIKWVNDVYLNGKKVCGILTEAITDFESGQIESLVVGIGINCDTKDFPDELMEIAGAVEGDYSKNQLAAQVIQELLELAEDLESRTFIKEYRELSLVNGKMISIYKGGFSPDKTGTPARVLDIDDNGGLVVLYSNGQQEILSSGEISIRL